MIIIFNSFVDFWIIQVLLQLVVGSSSIIVSAKYRLAILYTRNNNNNINNNTMQFFIKSIISLGSEFQHEENGQSEERSSSTATIISTQKEKNIAGKDTTGDPHTDGRDYKVGLPSVFNFSFRNSGFPVYGGCITIY